jgi:hypothetical protein
MKKYLFLATAVAGMMLAGCSNDDFIADTSPVVNPEEADVPILFSSNKGNITRANDITGAAAAELLGNKFVVSGYKGSETKSVGTIVFDNYLVEYAPNTAYTTESNTHNWEYVGKGRIKHAIDNGITNQTIKYWDYSQPQYDFIAWSTGKKTAIYEGEPADGQVLVSAIKPSQAGTAAFTMKGKAVDLEGCYVADIVTMPKSKFGETVTLRFRSLGSKVRIGIYETVPGYSVRDVKFYSAAATDDANAATPRLFTTVAGDIFTEGTYTIFYPTVDHPEDADNNQAHISFAGTSDQTTLVNFGPLNLTIAEDGEKTAGNVFIGRTSNTASMAGEAEGNYYTQYLPNERGTNLNLRVDYTLESTDGSGEVINVRGATAQVPLIYAQWKAGYAYTYLFKISDRTNGHTGVYDPTKPDDTTVNSDPAGLYPITFDAVVVNSEEDNTQETITTVSTPSITTYQKGSNVVNDNEYVASVGDIYVTVNDGDSENTPDLANGKLQDLTDKAALYVLPNDGKTYTEAFVVDALSIQDDDAQTGTIKGRSGLVLSETAFNLTNTIEYGADGNVIDLTDGTTNKALVFTPTAGTTYAFVYTKKEATTTTEEFQPVSVTVGQSVAGLYRYGLKNAPAGDVQEGVLYFINKTSGQVSVFLGQTVNNLYLDNAGQQIASGYAKTGTTYYYTIDNGMTYQAAHAVAYDDFETTTLYTFNGTSLTEKPAGAPQNNTAYYYKDGDTYTYCVIYPQRTRDGAVKLMVLNTTGAKVACTDDEIAYKGMPYFDKFSKNDGVYYTKIIKVQ